MKRGERVHESAVRSNPGLAEKIVRGHPVILSKERLSGACGSRTYRILFIDSAEIVARINIMTLKVTRHQLGTRP